MPVGTMIDQIGQKLSFLSSTLFVTGQLKMNPVLLLDIDFRGQHLAVTGQKS